MSAKQEQVLKIDPPVELTFTGKIIAFILIILQEFICLLTLFPTNYVLCHFRAISSSCIFNHDTY